MTASTLACAVLLLGVAAPDKPGGAWQSDGFASMSTRIDVTLPEPAAKPADVAVVRGAFEAVEREMNEWRAGSPLARVNAQAGKGPTPVPPALFALLRRGIELGELTGGAFDVSWAALWGLWDFRAAKPELPDTQEIAARAKRVDYRRIVLDDAASPPTVTLPDPGMKLGLGGIAKGHALDRAAAALRARGRSRFLLSAGGQVYAGGAKLGDGTPWRVGVRDPRGGAQDWFAFIDVVDASVSTSGDYERFFIDDKGVRRHHILDPRTGWPAQAGIRSATVVVRAGAKARQADPATLADALSTALMILPSERGLALAQGLPEVDALLVLEDGRLLATPALKPRLTVVRPPTQ